MVDPLFLFLVPRLTHPALVFSGSRSDGAILSFWFGYLWLAAQSWPACAHGIIAYSFPGSLKDGQADKRWGQGPSCLGAYAKNLQGASFS